MLLHHAAIIISSEASVEFYKDLGFTETERINREKDQIIWMNGNGTRLELFLDPSHPPRVTDPEAHGLRHIAFEIENLEVMREQLKKYNPEPIKEKYRIFFVKDPDGQPIEIREKVQENTRMFKGTNIKPFEKRIYLSSPTMHGEELKFVKEAYETNWMSTVGKNIDEVERIAAEKVGVKYAVGLCNCTAALHLCCKLAGEKLYGKPALNHGALEGKKVFCSDMTFVATVNPVVYEGGIPVFIDTESSSWNMDPVALEKAFEMYPDVKLVICAELYGFPGRIDLIRDITHKHGALLIEDAAEAMGATVNGKQCGSFGDYSTISYNGNKIITGSSGGCFLTNNLEDANHVRKLSTQAREVAPWYQHTEVGYNYRMSNIIAGVIRGQYPHLEEHIAQKKAIYERYKEGFKGLPVKMNPITPGTEPNYWLSALTIDPEYMCKQVRDDSKASYVKEPGKTCPTEILEAIASINAEGRPIWKPMHMQPMYAKNVFVKLDKDTGSDIFDRGCCLPSDNKMTKEEQEKIIEEIRECFGE